MAEPRKHPWSRDVRCFSCARIVNCGYFHAGFSELYEDKPILKVIDLHAIVPGATQKLQFSAPRPAT